MRFDQNGQIVDDTPTQDVTEATSTSTEEATTGVIDAPEHPETEDTGTSTETETDTENIEDDTHLTEEQKEKLPRAVRERIAERKKRQAAETRAEQLQQRVQELENNKSVSGTVDQAPTTQQEPKAQDYATWEAYQTALIDFKMDQKVAAKVNASVDSRLSTNAFTERLNKATEKNPELVAVLKDKSLAAYVTPAISQVIRESDNPGGLILHLHNNPAELFRLSQLSPLAAIKEMGKIEARIETPHKETTRRISQAPEPTRTTQARGATGTDESTMSDKDWFSKDRDTSISSSGGRRQK